MTEAEWMACDEPWQMLNHLGSKVSNRKLRLFCVAWCRTAGLQPEIEIATTFDLMERYADGMSNDAELLAARMVAYRRLPRPRYVTYPVVLSTPDIVYAALGKQTATIRAGLWYLVQTRAERRQPQITDLLRDVFGNPFRSVAFSTEWRTSTAVAIASQMYESRDFSAMPILADALQDAGCDTDDILNHCRDAKQTHVRGCWVVDLVLGKQ
jgi:hypothetical protein